MTKLTLSPLDSLENESTALATINANSALIVTALENTLSRDGTVPNQLTSSLDVNSQRILNLPMAVNPTEPVRLQEVGNAPSYATAAAASAAASAASAVTSTNQASISTAQAVIATTQAGNAATSATQAQGYVVGLSGTSTTSLLIATGSKSFTTQSGKLWVAGQFVTASSNANSANYMHGSVTSYSGTSLIVNVLDIGGSGTLADWNITISGTQGSQGIQGPTGPSGAVGVSGTPTVNQFTTFTNATTIQGTSLTGLVKGNGASAPTAAVSATDYAPATTGTAILKASSGGFANAVSGTDYQAPIGTISGIAKGNGANLLTAATAGTDYVSPTVATAFSAQQYFTIATITDAANLAWTVSSGQKGKVTLGGNRTMNAVTGGVEGATYSLWVLQDATGSRTISWTTTGSGSFDFGTAGAPTLTTTASRGDLLTFEAISLNGTFKLRFIGIMRGFV